MKIIALIPVKRFETSKTRLDFTKNQKIVLTQLMLKNTIINLIKCNSISTIVTISADERVKEISNRYKIENIYSNEKGVNYAIKVGDEYCKEKQTQLNIIIPIDLVFINSYEIELLLSMASKYQNCSIIVPSMRMDGTNILLRKPFNSYQTSYDNNSYYEHIQSSKRSNEQTIIINSANLSEDLDTMDDYKRIISRPSNHLSHLISRITDVI
jgi:2-phospho-L-lactate guanylyltransferase